MSSLAGLAALAQTVGCNLIYPVLIRKLLLLCKQIGHKLMQLIQNMGDHKDALNRLMTLEHFVILLLWLLLPAGLLPLLDLSMHILCCYAQRV